jgi:hypothetical protein
MTTRLAVVLSLTLGLGIAAAQPEPAPPYPLPPPPRTTTVPTPPPPRRVPVVRVVDPTPPPLSPMMRAIYAPFYVAGLIVRYGVYYVVVAPIEVLSRTIAYGAEGGVERREPERRPPPPEEGQLK